MDEISDFGSPKFSTLSGVNNRGRVAGHPASGWADRCPVVYIEIKLGNSRIGDSEAFAIFIYSKLIFLFYSQTVTVPP